MSVLALGGLLTAWISLSGGGAAPTLDRSGSDGALQAAIAEVPLAFEPNAGRAPQEVDFVAHPVGDVTVGLTATGALLSLPAGDKRTRPVRIGLHNGDPGTAPEPISELAGKVNLFRGRDPSRWRSGLPTYARVRYPEVWPGIDVDYYGDQRRLEYDFRLDAHADARRISLELRGADSARLAANGDLVIRAGRATLRQAAPVAYQEAGGKRRLVESAYVLRGRRIGFRLGSYDRSRPLVIDPLVLGYSSYLGGAGEDTGEDIAVDAAGAAYVTGTTASANFPVADHAQPDQLLEDAYVTKLDPDSGGALTLAYSTYLGGDDGEQGTGIAVDSSGAAYVTGTTTSANFPSDPDRFQSFQGGVDAFAVKLNPDGGGSVTLAYSTYLGGSASDIGSDIAVDSAGSAYVTGFTTSSAAPGLGSVHFPLVDAVDGFEGGDTEEAFITKVNPEPADVTEPSAADDLTLGYSTVLGGGLSEAGRGVAVEPSNGAAYVTGTTESNGPDCTTSCPFPNVDAFQPAHGGGNYDAFVTKFNPEPADVGEPSSADDVSYGYSTYLGGGGPDHGHAIALDAAAGAYVTGSTQSAAAQPFPLQDAFQGDQGGEDVFVTKINPDSGGAVSLAYSTYLGGGGSENAFGIAVDAARAAYVTGGTGSSGATPFPTADPLQAGNQGNGDAFVTKFNPDSGGPATLSYSTYLGGAGSDTGLSIAADPAGVAFLSGVTYSSGVSPFPTRDAFQAGNQGLGDAFVANLLHTPASPTAPAGVVPAAGENPECGALRARISALNRRIKRAGDPEQKAKLKRKRRKLRRHLIALGC